MFFTNDDSENDNCGDDDDYDKDFVKKKLIQYFSLWF